MAYDQSITKADYSILAENAQRIYQSNRKPFLGLVSEEDCRCQANSQVDMGVLELGVQPMADVKCMTLNV